MMTKTKEEVEAIERATCDDGLTFLELVTMSDADYNRHLIRREKAKRKQAQEQAHDGGAGDE